MTTTRPKEIKRGHPIVDDNYPFNFFRSVKWCPDATVLLAQGEDRAFQLIGIENTEESLEPDRVLRQAGPILDYAWYPGAKSKEPSTYCFAASVRECPVKILDASNGRLRASYKIVDHRERQIAPHGLAFNRYGTHLYCGFENAIEVFDIQRPGEGIRLSTTPSRKSKDGMKGIVSSISFCPDDSGVYAAGSLSGAITLFSETTGDEPVAYLQGMTGPITQVLFNPTQPHLLYAAQRRSDNILSWDTRYPHVVYQIYSRNSKDTNQTLKFDIDASGQLLAAGDVDGNISAFNLFRNGAIIPPVRHWKAHDDAVGGVAFQPWVTLGQLCSVSGSRHFGDSDHEPSDAELDTVREGPQIDESSTTPKDHKFQRNLPHNFDSSLRVWALDG